MTPKRSILLWAALLSQSKGVRAEEDTTSLLQRPVRRSQLLAVRKSGVHLLETAETIVSKVNAGDDPSGCAAASDATRAAVEEAISAVLEQHTHFSNQVRIAAQAVERCSSQGGDLSQQGVDLQTLRSNHQTCRLTEHGLEDGVGACQQYATLRNSLENCFSFPNDEGAFPEALQQARDELDRTFNQAALLREECNNAREALVSQHAECALAQHMFEEDYCVYRSNCAGVQACHANTEDAYRQTVVDIQAALATLYSEYQVLKHVECLLGHADEALAQSIVVSGDAIGACSEPASTDELTIDFATFGEFTACESNILFQPPCQAGFFEAEYRNLPQREAIQVACTECPALPGASTMPTEAPAAETPYDCEICRQLAEDKGLAIGGAGHAFTGAYTHGCYTYTSGGYACHAYCGTGGSVADAAEPIVSASQARLDDTFTVPAQCVPDVVMEAPTEAPAAETPYDCEICRQLAEAKGLAIGGAGHAFTGAYTHGCYTYTSGGYACHAYCGTGASVAEASEPIVSASQARLDDAFTVPAQCVPDVVTEAPTEAPADETPYDCEICRQLAEAKGLTLGGAGYAFTGAYTHGCYTYRSGGYACHAYCGTGGSVADAAEPIVSASRARLDDEFTVPAQCR